MRKIIAVALLAMFGFASKSEAAFVGKTISSTTFVNGFAASDVLLLKPNESMNYSLSGGATGTIHLEKSLDGGANYTVIFSSTDNSPTGSRTGIEYSGDRDTIYRFRASTITAGAAGTGSFNVTLQDNDDFVAEFRNRKNVPTLNLYDETIRLTNNSGIKLTEIIPSTETNTFGYGVYAPYYLAGATNGFMGHVVIATTPVSNQVAVVIAPAALNQTRVVGVIKSSSAFSGPIDVYDSGIVYALSTGTIVPGDMLGTSLYSAGYLQVTQSSNPVVAISLGTGITSGGLLRVKLK